MYFLRFLCLCLPLALAAQIEVEIIEGDEPDEAPVEAPDSRDHSSTPGRTSDSLLFLNGNELTGSLQGIGEEGLIWKHPDATADIAFGLPNLKQVALKTDPAVARELLDLPRVELTNGDVYRGEVVKLQGGTLTLDSPAFGEVELNARMVRAITPMAVSSTLYQGPNSIEEWELHNHSGGDESWEFRDGSLTAKGRNQVALLDIEDLPDRYTLSFDLEWKGMLNFQMAFWGQNTQNPNTNCYAMSLQNNYLRAWRNYNNLGRNNFGNQQVQQELNDGRARVTLHLDKPAKQMYLLLNGTLQGQWRDVFDGKIRGDQFMLYTQGNSSIRVSNILIRQWDGELRVQEEEEGNSSDLLITANGDEFVGEVQEIVKGSLSFKNEFAKFEVPLDRVAEIRLGAASRAQPRLMEGDVRVMTSSREQMTLQLESIVGGVLKGTSETTGNLDLRLRYFADIQFNPYDERHNLDDEAW